MRPGLVSITFRKLSPEQIIELAARAGLEGIEWGGDVHVPHGDTARAEEVARRTRDAGLSVASYGSYYRCDGADFAPVLDTALALGAPIVRVWAGAAGSAAHSAEERRRVARAAQDAAERCARNGIQLAFEFHGNTLTDTVDSALALIAETSPAKGYWQPAVGPTDEEQLASLRRMLPHAVALHTFSWVTGTSERLALAAGKEKWMKMLGVARELPWALIEFVRGDQPEQLAEDAKELRAWLSALALTKPI